MSVAWVLVLSGKAGASNAYWTPAVLGASLVTVRALVAFRLKGELLAQQMVFNGILCFALLQLVFFAPGFVNGHLRGDPVQMAHKREVVERLRDFVKPQALVGGRAPDIAIAAGMRFAANDWSLFTFPSSPFFPRLNQALIERRLDALLVYPGEMDSYPGYKVVWRGEKSLAGELVILTPSKN